MSARHPVDRRAMIAKIHVAKKQLGLEDDAYRAILQRVTSFSSSAACQDEALHSVLAEFQRLGFQPPAPQQKRSEKPWVRKVWAIWGELRPLLDAADTGTLRAFTIRQTQSPKNPAGIADPEFLDPAEAKKVIHGLEGWLKGVKAKAKETGNGKANGND